MRLRFSALCSLVNFGECTPTQLVHDIAKVAVIGPHAEGVVVGFPAYTYPAALKQLQGKASGGGDGQLATATGLAQVRGYRGATMVEDDLRNRLQADLEQEKNDAQLGSVVSHTRISSTSRSSPARPGM